MNRRTRKIHQRLQDTRYRLAADLTVALTAGGAIYAENPGGLVGPGRPSLGPFEQAFGVTLRTAFNVVLAVVLFICMCVAAYGLAQQRFGSGGSYGRGDSHEQGKSKLTAGLIGIFGAGSLTTIANIIWEMSA